MNNIFQTIGPLGSTSKIQSLDLWEARPRFQTIGPLGSMPKLQSIGPLGSTSKLQSIGPLGSMSKFNPSDLWEACPNFNLWTSRKHVQDSNPSDLWEARPNFNPLDLWEARPKIQIHQTIGKHVLYTLIYNMTICNFIYMHHTFTTVKY